MTTSKSASEYARLMAQKRDVELRLSALKLEVLSEMKGENLTKMETTFGKFTRAKKNTWTYTDKVKELEDKVKVEKIKEQEKGDAKMKTTEYLMFKEA